MADYISREAAIEAAKHAWAKGLEPSQYLETIPAADVEPVRHGRWAEIRDYLGDETGFYSCTVCKLAAIHRFDYCPSCGAKMDLED